MKYIYIGKITSTHGLKGELKILSNFEKKDKVFIKGNFLYVGDVLKKEEIITHRTHKNFNLVTFKGYEDINLVEDFRGQNVYALREDLNLEEDEILILELIGYICISNNEKFGTVKEVLETAKNKYILLINKNGKDIYIPYEKEFIEKINKNKKEIYFNLIEGMI